MSSVQEVIDQKKARAERFGTEATVSEADKRKLRQARFAVEEKKDALTQKLESSLSDVIKSDAKARRAARTTKTPVKKATAGTGAKKAAAPLKKKAQTAAPLRKRGAAAPKVAPAQTSRQRGLRAATKRAPRADAAASPQPRRAPVARAAAVSRRDSQSTPARRGRVVPRTQGTQFGAKKAAPKKRTSSASSLAMIDPAEHQRRQERKAKFAGQ